MMGLGLILTARDLATPTLNAISNRFRDMGEKAGLSADAIDAAMASIGKGAAVAAAGTVGLLVMKKVADVAGEFEYRMAAVGEIMGATDEQFQELTDSALDAGMAMTQFDPTQAADGLQVFAQAGFEATEAMAALRPALDMAAASIGQLSIEKAAGLAVGGIRVFRKEASDARWMLDRMAKATFMSRMQFKDLPLALGVVARGVSITNASLEDTLISLALVRNEINTVERASTAVASSMMKLARVPVQKRLRELGVQLKDTRTGGFRPFLDIIGDMTNALKDMDAMQRQTWLTQTFQIRSVAGLTAIMGQLSQKARRFEGDTNAMQKAIAELRTEMDQAGGTMVRLRDKLLDTWKGQKQALSAMVRATAIVVGDSIAKNLRPFVSLLMRAFKFIAEGFRKLDPWVKRILTGLVAMAAAIAVVTGGVIAFFAIVKLAGITSVAMFTGILLVVGKIVLAIAAVVAAVKFMKAAWDANLGGLADTFGPVFNKIALFFKAMRSLFKFSGFHKDLADELNKAENKGVKKFALGVFFFLHRITTFLRGIKAGMAGIGEILMKTFIPGLEKTGPLVDNLDGKAKEWYVTITNTDAAIVSLMKSIHELLVTLGLAEEVATSNTQRWWEAGLSIGNLIKLIGHLISWAGYLLKAAFWPINLGLLLLSGTIKHIIIPLFKIWEDELRELGKILLVVGGVITFLIATVFAPFIAVIMAVAAAWAFWPEIVDTVESVLDDIKYEIDEWVKWLKDIYKDIEKSVEKIAKPFKDAAGAISDAWEGAKKGVGAAWNWMGDRAKDIGSTIGSAAGVGTTKATATTVTPTAENVESAVKTVARATPQVQPPGGEEMQEAMAAIMAKPTAEGVLAAATADVFVIKNNLVVEGDVVEESVETKKKEDLMRVGENVSHVPG